MATPEGGSVRLVRGLGAALAYYTVFSIAPLLVIAVSIDGWVFGAEAVQSQLDEQMQGFLGKEGAEAVQSMIAAANKPKSGTVATALGVAALLLGASGVFTQMKDALNTNWEVTPRTGRGVWGFITDRFLSKSVSQPKDPERPRPGVATPGPQRR